MRQEDARLVGLKVEPRGELRGELKARRINQWILTGICRQAASISTRGAGGRRSGNFLQSVGIKDSVEMVTFVLEDDSSKAFDCLRGVFCGVSRQ